MFKSNKRELPKQNGDAKRNAGAVKIKLKNLNFSLYVISHTHNKVMYHAIAVVIKRVCSAVATSAVTTDVFSV